MRPIANFTLHAVLAAALAAFAATSAAAADIYLKLGDPKAEGAGGGQIELQSFHWGPRQSTSKLQPGGGGGGAAQRGVQVAAGDLDGDGRADVSATETTGGSQASSGLPTGKRQHKPVTITKEWEKASPAVTEKRQHGWVTVSKPVESGSMMFRGSLPGCTVGAAYPDAVLQTADARYELKDVVISGCAGDGATLNYAKVKVRGWDPEKKEDVAGEAKPR